MEEIKFLRGEINFKNEIIFDKSNNDYDVDKTIKEKNVSIAAFHTQELVNLFVKTKNFSYCICHENIGQKYSKILKSQETDRPLTDKSEQYPSKRECYK